MISTPDTVLMVPGGVAETRLYGIGTFMLVERVGTEEQGRTRLFYVPMVGWCGRFYSERRLWQCCDCVSERALAVVDICDLAVAGDRVLSSSGWLNPIKE